MLNDVEKLETAARDRWEDAWTIRQLHFADGTTSAHAFRTHGHAEEGKVEKERLFVGADDDIYHDRIVLNTETIVKVVESDDPPEGVSSEIGERDSGRGD